MTPGLLDAGALESASLWNNSDACIFSSPEHFVLKVSFCDRLMSVVRRPSSVVRRASSTIASIDFFSETAWPNLMKLHRNVPWVNLSQSCSNGSGPLHIGATKGK